MLRTNGTCEIDALPESIHLDGPDAHQAGIHLGRMPGGSGRTGPSLGLNPVSLHPPGMPGTRARRGWLLAPTRGVVPVLPKRDWNDGVPPLHEMSWGVPPLHER